MTVCIAAMCDNGKRVVAATDGGITLGPISGDINIYKSIWLSVREQGEWAFLHAGTLGNSALIIEEFERLVDEDPSYASRAKIQSGIRLAFKRRYSEWISDRVLSPYGFDLDEFKAKGKNLFGDQKFNELCQQIETASRDFDDQCLVVGWGKTEHSAMIYEISRWGAASHKMIGAAAIGSGTEVALSTLLLLGHSRMVSLEDTLYAVAAAKFSAENSYGVGRSTAMAILRKGDATIAEDRSHVYLVPDIEITILRDLWEEHGKPRVPPIVAEKLEPIVKHVGSEIRPSNHFRLIAHLQEMSNRFHRDKSDKENQTGTTGESLNG